MSVESAAHRLEVAEAELVAFDHRTAGLFISASMAHERRQLEIVANAARLSWIMAKARRDETAPATEPRATTLPTTKKPGPPPMVTRERVELTRAALQADMKPDGPTAIARALNVHPSTVRRRLRGD